MADIKESDLAGLKISASTELLDTWAVSRDCWPRDTLDFWHATPQTERPDIVFWPESATDVAKILAVAKEKNKPVVTYGAGSGVCGGAAGRAGAIVIDTKRLNAIGPLDESRGTVCVQAGVNGQHLEDWLNARGYTLGHSPSSISCSTIGGWAAARGAGQFSSYYGVFEDMVVGVTAVSPDSGIFRVGLDGTSDSENMCLLLGSEGTLGVLTEFTLRVRPLPQQRWLRGFQFHCVEDAVEAMRLLMQDDLWPSVLRLYDPVDTLIGGKTKKKTSKSERAAWYAAWVKGITSNKQFRSLALRLPLSYPAHLNTIVNRLSKGCLLIVGFEGPEPLVDVQTRKALNVLKRQGTDLGEDPGWRWFHSRHAVSYKLMPIFEAGGFADTMEVACRWSQLVPLYHAVRRAVSAHAIVMAHMSHAYQEGGSIYFSFAGKGNLKTYEVVWKSAMEAVLANGATVTHHHGVGVLKKSAVTQEIGHAVAGWYEAKKRHDANGLMNPGRLFDDTPVKESPAPPELCREDGLLALPCMREKVQESERKQDIRWPWESYPPPPTWLRTRWQVPWTEVMAVINGGRVRLGRGPRSASGPDLRYWTLKRNEAEGQVIVPACFGTERWYGEVRCDAPWVRAREILRYGFRPSICTVRDGLLCVGLRGSSASEMGEILSTVFALPFEGKPWVHVPLPSGRLLLVDSPSPRTIGVTEMGFLEREHTDG